VYSFSFIQRKREVVSDFFELAAYDLDCMFEVLADTAEGIEEAC